MAQASDSQTSPRKKRLTGFILLAIMVAIAAPFVVRSPEEVRVALDLEIPPAPVVPALPEAEVVPEQELADVEKRLASVSPGLHPVEAEESSEQVEEKAEEAAPDKPPVKPVITEGWAVQLASFAEASNADAMVKKLRDAGYAAYSRSNAERTLYRVYAGPELEREQALTLRERLAADSRIGLEGLVVSYAL